MIAKLKNSMGLALSWLLFDLQQRSVIRAAKSGKKLLAELQLSTCVASVQLELAFNTRRFKCKTARIF